MSTSHRKRSIRCYRVRVLAQAALFLISSLYAANSLSAQPRVALVIGNNSYLRISQLDNAVNDAISIAQELRKSGFQIISVVDGKAENINEAKHRFLKAIAHGGIGVFFFSGHGAYKLSLLPSGVVRRGKLSVIGNGVVIDPHALIWRSCRPAWNLASMRPPPIAPTDVERINDLHIGKAVEKNDALHDLLGVAHFFHGFAAFSARSLDGLAREGISVPNILDEVDSAKPTVNIVILDSCL